MWRLLLSLLVLGGALLSVRPGIAWAHASLLRSSPSQGAVLTQAPAQIQLWFSEPIDLPVRALTVRGPDGKLADIGHPQIAPDDNSEMVDTIHATQSGTYVVRWKVISADTHVVWDSFQFSVGAPSAVAGAGAEATTLYTTTTEALQAAARWLNLLGGALLIGPFVLWWWTLNSATADLEVHARRRVWRRLLRISGCGIGLIVLGVPLALLAQMAALSDSWADALTAETFAQVFDARLGLLCILRVLVALSSYVVGSVLIYLGPPAPRLGRGAMPPLLGTQVALGMLVLISSSLAGHAVSTDPIALSLMLDWLHLAAMAVWVGGLFGLAFALPVLLSPRRPARGDAGPDLVVLRWRVLGRVVPSFSTLAVICVLTLAATGLYSALRNVSGLDQLVTTSYGRALSIKLGLLVVVLASASINLLVLGPALRAVAGGASPRVADLWPIFRPLLRTEVVLVVALLAAVGLLTSLAPARQAATPVTGAVIPISVQSVVDSGPHAVLAGHVGFTLITLAIAPSTLGSSPVAVSMVDAENRVVRGTVLLRVTPPSGSGLATVDAALGAQPAVGQYAGSVLLSGRGIWNLQLDAAPQGSKPAALAFQIELPLRPGAALLQRADRAMNALHSLVMDQVVTAGERLVPSNWQFQAPDRVHNYSPNNIEAWRIGRMEYTHLTIGRWDMGRLPPEQAYHWPAYTYAREGSDGVVIGHEAVDGSPCDIVAYWVPYPNFSVRLWIDQQSGLIRRSESLLPGDFEYDHLHGFNSAPPVVAPHVRGSTG